MANTPAQQRRYDAINTMVKNFLPESRNYTIDNTQANREAVAEYARKMVTLGRTDRWRSTCEQTALKALSDSDLGWVVRQYAIYLGYDAE